MMMMNYAMLPRESANICDVMLVVLQQSVSAMDRLGVCKYDDGGIYHTWVGIIEVPLGANVIPKRAALEYFLNVPLCILLTFL